MDKWEKEYADDKYVCTGKHIDIAEDKEGRHCAERKLTDKCESLDEDADYKIDIDCPVVQVTYIEVIPAGVYRDVVAAYWEIKFLVDSTSRRLIKILGETPIEDYPDGESEMTFSVDSIDVSGIPPSTLTNSGLLMATFKVHGEEVASVNLVVNVTQKNGNIVREILNPLE